MTGNVVLLGFGIAGSSGLPVVAPIGLALAAFSAARCRGRMGVALARRSPTSLAR